MLVTVAICTLNRAKIIAPDAQVAHGDAGPARSQLRGRRRQQRLQR